MDKNIKDVLFEDILSKINAKGINSLVENVDFPKRNTKYFDEFFQFSSHEQKYPSSEFAACVQTEINDIKKIAQEKNTREAIKGKRELTYNEMMDIGVGDYVSHRNMKKEFIKGTVTEIREKTYLIKNKDGIREIPKDYTIRFFNGQKFDAREIGYNFLNLNLGKQNVKEIDLNNVLRNFNLNAKYLTFSDLDKKNRLLLLKGQETGVIGINIKIEQNGKIVTRSEKIRLFAYRHNSDIILQKIKGFDQSVYGRPIPDEDLQRMKSGETLIYRDLVTKEKNTFDVAAFYDKGLDQVRVKSLNEKDLEKLTVLVDYKLSDNELKILNTTGQLDIKRFNREGKEIEYSLSYNKPLNDLKIKKKGFEKKTTSEPSPEKPLSPKEKRKQKQEDYLLKQKNKFNKQKI